MMRLITCVLLGSLGLSAQTFSQTARRIVYGASLPATCRPSTGDVWFKTTATLGPYYCSATNTWSSMGGGSSGVSSLNSLTGALSVASGTSGTDFAVSTAGATVTLNLPTASAANRGALSTADWTTFNSKVGTARSIVTTSPITGGGDLSADRTLACATCGVTGSPLSQFAATTSAQLRGVISDESGTGVLFFQGGSIGAATGDSLSLLGGLALGGATSTCDGTAACEEWGQGTLPTTLPANTIQDVSPTSITAYRRVRSNTITASGFSFWTRATSPVVQGTETFVAANGTGNVCLTNSCSMTAPNLGTPSAAVLTNATGLPEGGLSTTDITTNNASTTKHGFAPKYPNDATKYLDGTGAYTAPPGGTGGTAGAPLFTQTAAVTVTATSETTLLGAGQGTLTIPANWFTVAGNSLIVESYGRLTTTTVPGTQRIRLKFGSSVILDTGAYNLVGSITNAVYRIRTIITARTVGASGTLIAQSIFETTGAALVANEAKLLNTSTITVDTTATQVVDFTNLFDTASNSITDDVFIMYGPGSAVSSVFGLTGAVGNLAGDVSSSGITTTIGAAKVAPSMMKASTFDAQSDGATITWAMASVLNAQASVTLAGNRTLNITNPAIGGNYVFKITQDGTGTRTLTKGTGCTFKELGSNAATFGLSTAAGTVDILTFTFDGTNCYANVGKDYK